jgi:gluconolactonase
VYYIPAGGQAAKVAEAPGAHGIQLSPDEKTLYSADSGGEHLIAFDVQPDGKLTNRRNFGKYMGLKSPESHADGIAVDSQGRVYVGIEPGVQVFSPKGDSLGLIPTSQRPQNLAFAGPDKKTLYLTGRSALFSVQMLSQGYSGRAK